MHPDLWRYRMWCESWPTHGILGPKQDYILAREGVAGEAGEEPDYRAEDGAGKATDVLQERGEPPI